MDIRQKKKGIQNQDFMTFAFFKEEKMPGFAKWRRLGNNDPLLLTICLNKNSEFMAKDIVQL